MSCGLKVAMAATAILAATAPLARADDCAAVYAAMEASIRTPVAVTMTRTTRGGPAVVHHMVRTEDATYVELHGKWRSMKISTQERLRSLDEVKKTAKVQCQRVGTDSVGAQSATVYTSHVENQGTVSDQKLWVSANNLLLKAELDIAGEHEHMVSMYDYKNVKVPADATPVDHR
ncbi:MAG: hypothetical protein J0I21_21395 [Alphaproteobacteria bacterium]|nr:hypothetical protein [Alphaproteobacteria bacterium]